MDRNIQPYIPQVDGLSAGLVLDLFVSTEAQREAICSAIKNVTRRHGIRSCSLKVFNIHVDTAAAQAQKIQTVPTIVRRSPGPERRIIGKLDDENYLRMALGVPTLIQ
jgi:circadian clock protein KaiB